VVFSGAMLVMKTRLGVPDQPEVRFSVDDDGLPSEAIDHVVGMLEELVRRGRRISPGQHIQIGWYVVKAVRGDDGCLVLLEPDGSSLPLQFKDGITDTLRQMLLQLWHADSYKIPRDLLQIPSIQQSCLVCHGLTASKGLLLSRSEPSDAMDSGWFVGCDDRAHDHNAPGNLTRISLYDAFVRKPGISPWIGFPLDSLIRLADGEHPEVFIGELECPLQKESFVDRVLHRGAPHGPVS